MIYDGVIRGRFVELRSVTLDDVEFTFNIRAEEKNRNTVGQIAATIEDQRKFIEWQIKEPDDYYFVVYNRKNERIGLIGIYDIHDGIGEFGREVNDGSVVEAMEAEILLEDFAIDILGLKRSCCVIYAHNKKHLNNLKRNGMIPLRKEVRSGVESFYFENELKKSGKTRELLAIVGDDFVG